MIYYLISHLTSYQRTSFYSKFLFSSIIDAFLSKIMDFLQNVSLREIKKQAAANKASDSCAASPKCRAMPLLLLSVFLTLEAKSKRILKQGMKLEDHRVRKARSDPVLTGINEIRIRLS